MEFTGQVMPYAVNRLLSVTERENQLYQQQRLDVPVIHQLTVIEINSNWMDVVDKYFFDKGMITFGGGFACCFITALCILALFMVLPELAMGNWEVWPVVLPLPIAAFLAYYMWQQVRKEINYTHYPIRFNRQTRMVHVFRQNGSVLTVKWDNVFFTQMSVTRGAWDIVGHVLDKDRTTVLETIALPATSVGSKGKKAAKGYWEFIRRYMEEGPASVVDVISGYLPITQQKETFKFSYERVAASLGSYFHPFILAYYLFYPGRWVAMRFSKIPQWPADIEAQCQKTADDPYFRDASMNQ